MDTQARKLNSRIIQIVQVSFSCSQPFGEWMPRYSEIGDAPVLDIFSFESMQRLEINGQKIRKKSEEVLLYRESLPNFQSVFFSQVTVSNAYLRKVLAHKSNWQKWLFQGITAAKTDTVVKV